MDLTNMTPTERAAWHRSEADRIEAEERARRPALAAGQVWRVRSDDGDSWGYWTALPVDGGICLYDVQAACGWAGNGGFAGRDASFEYVGLARDVLRVVPPGSDEDDADCRIIQQRDEWEEKATNLAEAVGLFLGVDVGEHSSSNCPVARALFAIQEREVQSDPPAPQVAPEPTGAELVGRLCWVRYRDGSPWAGPVVVVEYDPHSSTLPYGVDDQSVKGYWQCAAKPYVEGVAP